MKTFNNELTIRRGETFTIDKTIQNKDGSPYIISSKLKNPYFLITVSTTRYQQENRYLSNYWLDLSDYPRFLSTQAFDLLSLTSEANGETPMYPNGFSDITARSSSVSTVGDYLVYGYIGDKLIFLDYTDCVFYVEDEDGNRIYKYWNDSVSESGGRIGWQDYDCKIVKTFLQEDTSQWVEQSYVYSIRLVSGQSMNEYLTKLCKDNEIECAELVNQEMYDKLISAGHIFNDNFVLDRMLVNFDTVMPILVPTKMSILSSINGELL